MTPTRSQRRWLKKYLKDARPIDMLPRAYCIAKPAPGFAVFVTPHEDYRSHLVTEEQRQYNSGVTISQSSSHIGIREYDIKIGDWNTVVYCELKWQGAWWIAVPPIPLHRVTKKGTKRCQHQKERRPN